MSRRGMITEEIKRLWPYELTQQQLRLMPYILYCGTNNRYIDSTKINAEERGILDEWVGQNILLKTQGALEIPYETWVLMSQIVYHAYHNFDGMVKND